MLCTFNLWLLFPLCMQWPPRRRAGPTRWHPGVHRHQGKAVDAGQNVARKLNDLQFRASDAVGLWVGQGVYKYSRFSRKGRKLHHQVMAGLQCLLSGTPLRTNSSVPVVYQ